MYATCLEGFKKTLNIVYSDYYKRTMTGFYLVMKWVLLQFINSKVYFYELFLPVVNLFVLISWSKKVLEGCVCRFLIDAFTHDVEFSNLENTGKHLKTWYFRRKETIFDSQSFN